MEVTTFIVSHRNEALLIGDYGSYRAQLSRRLLTLRRRLGRASPKGKKYIPKPSLTREDLTKDPEHAKLLLLAAERAWAHAMHMKSMHAADSSEKAITGSTKKHIVSRLRRAVSESAHLTSLLLELQNSSFTPGTLLEARAYHSMLQGSKSFEAQKWERSLVSYAEAYCAYHALSKVSSGSSKDAFQELLSSTVEPSIRYAAYQLRLPRTLSIERLAARYAQKDAAIVQQAKDLYPAVLEAGPSIARQDRESDSKDIPKTITWRKRKVNLEDASVAQALALAHTGEQQLAKDLKTKGLSYQDQAAAYDHVLNPSQDAVDATVTAISELTAEGVSPGDPRMQALQITRTAVNYALVGWRIGRNRVLCGSQDGAYVESEVTRRKKSQDGSKKIVETVEEQDTSKKLLRLRERVALIDSTLQSLDSIRDLPGVVADDELQQELSSRRSYFAALRCLNIAHGHALLSSFREALALYARGAAMAKSVRPDSGSGTSPPNLEVFETQATFLTTYLENLTHQYQALAELSADSVNSTHMSSQNSPWVEHLHEYPAKGAVDLTQLVDYPPRLRPVPVKPIFLDLAWKHINYPGPKEETKKAEAKRGWWFGRS